MMIRVSKVMFFTSLLSGTVLAMSANSWFTAWCGMELNLLSFIPFICLKKDVYVTESSLKYFLIQALGSSMIIISSLCMVAMPTLRWLISSALLLKMGAAPLHFWLPSVMSGLSWGSCLVLMSVQKIAPISVLTYVMGGVYMGEMLMFSVVLGAFIGSVGGLNQVLLRKIMAYSSINHMSWMLVGVMVGDRSWMIYFFFYVFVSGSVLYLFYIQQMNHICDMAAYGGSMLKLVTCMSLLSLGGLPPFTGFIPKWLMIQEMLSSSYYYALIFLLSSTLVSLYYYMRLTYMSLVLGVSVLSWPKSAITHSGKMSFYMYISLMGMFLPSLFMLM